MTLETSKTAIAEMFLMKNCFVTIFLTIFFHSLRKDTLQEKGKLHNYEAGSSNTQVNYYYLVSRDQTKFTEHIALVKHALLRM